MAKWIPENPETLFDEENWFLREFLGFLIHKEGLSNIYPIVEHKKKFKGINLKTRKERWEKTTVLIYGNSKNLQDHKEIYHLVLEAIKRRSIIRKDDPSQSIGPNAIITKESALSWFGKKSERLEPLRHFPASEKDLLKEFISHKSPKENTHQPVEQVESTRPEEKGKKKTPKKTKKYPRLDRHGRAQKAMKKLKDGDMDSAYVCSRPDIINMVIDNLPGRDHTKLDQKDIANLKPKEFEAKMGFALSSFQGMYQHCDKPEK